MTTSLKDSNPFNVLASTASASGAAAAVPSPAVDDVNLSINDDAAPDIEDEEDTTPEQAKDIEDPFAQEQSKKDVDDDMESQKKSSDLIMRKLTRSANKNVKPFVWLVAVTAALGGLIFGYDMGGSGGTFVMDGFNTHFGWDTASQSQIDKETGLINALFGAGAAVGALFAPYLFNGRGRKSTMVWGAITFTIGAAIQAAAVDMPMLYIPRLLSGFGIGMLSMCSPVYIEEVAPESHRGSMGTLWQLAITAGILLASILNIFLADWDEGWRISYGGNTVFSVALLGLLTIMPESPHFLISKGRQDDARKALEKVRFDDQIDWEIEELTIEHNEKKELGEATWSEVFSRNNKMRSRTVTGMLLQTFQQLSGINAIMFYAPIIFDDFFGSKGGIYGSLALNVINFFSTFITMATIDKFGRVKILFSGCILMCFALIVTASLSGVDEAHAGDVANQSLGIGIIVFCALYVIGFAYSWGPVVWVVCAEMFPMRERGKANSLSTFSNWFWTTIIGYLFPMASTASLTACFIFFAVVVFFAILFVYFFLPETADRTALEIDEEYLNHKPECRRKKWN